MTVPRLALATLATLATTAATGCRSQAVTSGKLETAFATTFANLIQTQEASSGLPSVDARAFRASAICHRVGLGRDAGGSGDWVCTALWSIPGRPGTLRDTYELSVAPDGCYTATADGSEAHVGGPSVKTSQGATVKNLLYVFDACFNP